MEQTIDDRRAALVALDERIAPVAVARERTLPVPAELAGLFAEGGLVRGRALSCRGRAATSLAVTLAAPTIAAGSWMAAIDVPELGLDAAAEAGVALERIVRVDTTGSALSGAGAGGGRVMASPRHRAWADAVAAAADGFDIVLTSSTGIGAGKLSPAVARNVLTRVRQRGAVLLVLGDPGALEVDGVVDAGNVRWSGLGAGSGHLRHRRLDVVASGRRIPGERRCTVHMPVARGTATPLIGVGGGEHDGADRAGDPLGTAPAVERTSLAATG